MTATPSKSASATAHLPHPRFRLPFLGDLATVDFAKPTQGLVKEARILGGIFEQRLFGWPVRILSSAALIEDVNNESLWEKHVGHAFRKLRPVAGDGLFTAYNHEPNCQKAHNILMPAFTKTAMTNYHHSIKETVRELTDAWKTDAHNRTWIDIPADTSRLTIEIISRAGFGYSYTNLSDRSENQFISVMLRELHYANRRTDVLPIFERLFMQKRKQQHYADKKYARQEVNKIIDERRQNPHDADHKDMLDIMLHAADPDTGEMLDDNNIGNQILTFLVAGSETSANAIAFALHYLSTNPAVAAQVRAEIDERWPGRQFPDIQFDDVAKLRSLRRVVDETLRLWPVAPGYFRQAKQDTTIGEGKYAFKAKDWVFVLLLAAHRDPAWGPDADEFNPDRFENIRNLPPHTYKPFGTGPRACIGRQFALHEILLTLAAILHQFDLEPQPGYQLKVSEMMTLKPANLQIRVRSRA